MKPPEIHPLELLAIKSADYKDVHVNLHGDGNVFVLIGKTHKALRRAYGRQVAEAFRYEAQEGDLTKRFGYDGVIQTIMEWVTVDFYCECGCGGGHVG